MKPWLTVLVFSTLAMPAFAALDQTYTSWAKVLSKNVVVTGQASKVKYNQLKQDPSDLEAFLKEVSAVTKAEYEGFTANQKLVFLINSYNAYTIKMILNNHKPDSPLKSIKGIGSFLKSTWKIKFFQFLGEESDLDRLEQELARPNFDEPRLHMGFNCASIGCPMLGNEPLLPEKMEQQLDFLARNFLKDKSRNYYKPEDKAVYVSKIFDWYGKDFKSNKRWGSLEGFLAEHMDLPADVKLLMKQGKIEIEFLDYDWNLNIAN